MLEIDIETLQESNKTELLKHVDLKVSILNAPHFHREDGRPYEIENYIKKESIPKANRQPERSRLSAEEKAKRWKEAGDVLVAQCGNLK